MVLQRSQGSLIILLVLFIYPLSFVAPSRMLTNFLLPIYGIGHFFSDPATASYGSPMNWTATPSLFGRYVPPVFLSLGLQWIIGVFVWRILVRKTAHPFQPMLLRWEAVGLFTILLGGTACSVVGLVAGKVSGHAWGGQGVGEPDLL
jgi:sorbitol-specific phosphotransferase system component IIC